MGIVLTNHSIDLLLAEFDEITKDCNYTSSVDGEATILTVRISIIRNIKGTKCSEELDKSTISVMPLQPKVSKISGSAIWDCICGKEVGFPVGLIGK